MEVMQKLTKKVAWLKDQIGRKRGARNTHYSLRNYFRCESINVIEEMFKNGDILSGLTILDRDGATVPDYVWCVYRKRFAIEHDCIGHEAE